MQPQSSNPYDFITNPAPAPKTSPFGGGSMKNRIIIAAGGLLVLIIVISIVANLLSSGGDSGVEQLKKVVARQAEIVRIAEAGTKAAQSPETRGFALTTSLSVQSDQAKVTKLLTENGIKLTPQELAAGKDADTDMTLQSATTNNRYDEALRTILDAQLNDYLTLLRTAYESTGAQTVKAVIEASYNSAENLLKP